MTREGWESATARPSWLGAGAAAEADVVCSSCGTFNGSGFKFYCECSHNLSDDRSAKARVVDVGGVITQQAKTTQHTKTNNKQTNHVHQPNKQPTNQPTNRKNKQTKTRTREYIQKTTQMHQTAMQTTSTNQLNQIKRFVFRL